MQLKGRKNNLLINISSTTENNSQRADPARMAGGGDSLKAESKFRNNSQQMCKTRGVGGTFKQLPNTNSTRSHFLGCSL
jgi:hypothetical protein